MSYCFSIIITDSNTSISTTSPISMDEGMSTNNIENNCNLLLVLRLSTEFYEGKLLDHLFKASAAIVSDAAWPVSTSNVIFDNSSDLLSHMLMALTRLSKLSGSSCSLTGCQAWPVWSLPCAGHAVTGVQCIGLPWVSWRACRWWLEKEFERLSKG
jgi:hypothetical protein